MNAPGLSRIVGAVVREGQAMRILRARPTASFVYLFVRCRCGRRFGHRADRRFIVCLQCGRIADGASMRRAAPAARWYRRPGSDGRDRAAAAAPSTGASTGGA
jgi:hypothetical protein